MRLRRFSALLVSLVIGVPVLAFAQEEVIWLPVTTADRQQVSEIHTRQRIAALTKLAGEGDASAQMSLGRIYELGRGVKADGAQAIEWFKRADQSGNPIAPLSIAAAYMFGNVVPRDPAEAARWTEKYQQRGGIVPCATMSSELAADPAVRSTLCAITHHWRIYAFVPTFGRSESIPDKPLTIQLGFNPKQKTLVVIESNAPQALVKKAQNSLMATISSIAMPVALAQYDGEVAFELRYALQRDRQKGLMIRPLHWQAASSQTTTQSTIQTTTVSK